MTQSDNWGWQARIGMFIVGTEVVPEAEWWAMVPPNVSVHAARSIWLRLEAAAPEASASELQDMADAVVVAWRDAKRAISDFVAAPEGVT